MADRIELDNSELDGPGFVDHEYWDETSQFDPHPTTRWCHGSEHYERRYRCRIPIGIAKTEDEGVIWDWIDQHLHRIKWLD